MNRALLHNQVQNYINSNWDKDLYQLALKAPSFPDVSNTELFNQLKAKSKARTKLPTWFNCHQIYYPSSVSMEQCSSEVTAEYKASLVNGALLIDVTGGFGVDDHYFSFVFDRVVHCELDTDLSTIVAHNTEILERSNISCQSLDGLAYLRNIDQPVDCIYLDPSRRSKGNQRVFLLEDCIPNVIEHVPLLLEKAPTVLIKLAPLLDITAVIKELRQVREVHVVATRNEVKELLFLLGDQQEESIPIHTINIETDYTHRFSSTLKTDQKARYGPIDQFLYEPNSAILKAGFFNEVSVELNLIKLNINSHLYTSNYLIDFPGRKFKVLQVYSYQPKAIKKLYKGRSFHIIARNFGDSVAGIRKKTGILEGDEGYLIFTSDNNNKRVVIHCDRIQGGDFSRLN